MGERFGFRPGDYRGRAVYGAQARRGPRGRRAGGDERRGDGRLRRELPAQTRHAEGLHRDVLARFRPLRAGRPHAPGCDQYDLLLQGGEAFARECFGEEAVWIPYIRPGFALSVQVGGAVKNNPEVKFVLLAKHGLVTWGDTHEESYGRTIEAINRAAQFVAGRAGEPFGGTKVEPLAPHRREALLAKVLPALRGALSSGTRGGVAQDTARGLHLRRGPRFRLRARLGGSLPGRRGVPGSPGQDEGQTPLGGLRPRERGRGRA